MKHKLDFSDDLSHLQLIYWYFLGLPKAEVYSKQTENIINNADFISDN